MSKQKEVHPEVDVLITTEQRDVYREFSRGRCGVKFLASGDAVLGNVRFSPYEWVAARNLTNRLDVAVRVAQGREVMQRRQDQIDSQLLPPPIIRGQAMNRTQPIEAKKGGRSKLGLGLLGLAVSASVALYGGMTVEVIQNPPKTSPMVAVPTATEAIQKADNLRFVEGVGTITVEGDKVYLGGLLWKDGDEAKRWLEYMHLETPVPGN